MPSLLELFRWLSSFEPERIERPHAPWEEFAAWALANGVAPLAAYNLEYRLGGGGAPESVRDQLLSVYQGSVNDNVMKLVNFKRAIDDLSGRQLILWGGASHCEALYPHVAFRPVLQIDLLVHDKDVEGLSGYLRRAHFQPNARADVVGHADRVLTDGRTEILLHTSVFDGHTTGEDNAVFSRALPMKVYGPSALRMSHEDALLSLCVQMAREAFVVPMITFVDLRELLLGARHLAGPYSHPPDCELLKARAKAWSAERALFAALRICQRLFPETESPASVALPTLRRPTTQLLERMVVKPVSGLHARTVRGSARLRRWLLGR